MLSRDSSTARGCGLDNLASQRHADVNRILERRVLKRNRNDLCDSGTETIV
jgi:hypothetical protein